jgi:hypothetical protein
VLFDQRDGLWKVDVIVGGAKANRRISGVKQPMSQPIPKRQLRVIRLFSEHVALTPSNAFITREILTAMGIESGLSCTHIVALNPKSPCAAPTRAHDDSFTRSNRA